MEQNNPNDSPESASATFGTVPTDAERFGNIRNGAEDFGSLPHSSERKESHTMTVREAARLFEAAGVARTERSVVNWCQPNRTGMARLDAYFDPNERRYFITPQSIELAIAEEKAKAQKAGSASEAFGNVPNAKAEAGKQPPDSEWQRETPLPATGKSADRFKVLEREIRDLTITNRAKDIVIDRYEEEKEALIEKLVTFSHKVGELQTRLLQLAGPEGRPVGLASEAERAAVEHAEEPTPVER